MAGKAKVVRNRLPDVAAAIEAQTPRAAQNAAAIAQGVASRTAPVDTGNLAGSPRTETDGSSAVVYTDVKYAPAVEFGTDRQAAQPYMRPAADEAARYLRGEGARSIRTEVEREAGR